MSDLVKVEQDVTYGETEYLSAQDHAFYVCFWETRRTITAAELNFIQEIQRDALGKLAAAVSQPGFSYRSNWWIEASAADETRNFFDVDRTYALTNDAVSDVAGNFSGTFTGPFGPVNLGPRAVHFAIPPDAGPGQIEVDLVFLEVWQASVGPTGSSASDTNVYQYGAAAPVAGILTNDLIRHGLTKETTRRVQTRWRIRTVENVTPPVDDSQLMAAVQVFAQGGATVPTNSYPFMDVGSERREYGGLWRAGNHDTVSVTDLGSEDGYTYALPMFKITRIHGQDPQVVDLRQLTNGNFVGVFELDAPCKLKIKAIPIEIWNCSATILEAVISEGPVATDLNGYIAARRLQSTQSGNTVPPLLVNSTALVSNLNADFVDSAHAGTGIGNVLLLDNNANAHIQGNELRIMAGPLNDLHDLAAIDNVNGVLWLASNARYLGGWSQVNPLNPSVGLSMDGESAVLRVQWWGHGVTAPGWADVLTIDKEGTNLTTLTTDAIIQGDLAIGKPTVPTATLDVAGNAIVTAATTAAGIAVTNTNGIGVDVSSGGSPSAIRGQTTAGGYGVEGLGGASGVGIYASSGVAGTAFQSDGLARFSKGARAATKVIVGDGAAADTNALLEVQGLTTTDGFRMPTGVTTGYVLTASADGTGTWQIAPSSGSSGMSGTAYRLAVFTATSTLADSVVWQTAAGSTGQKVGVDAGGVGNILSTVSSGHGLLLNAQAGGVSIADTVIGPTDTSGGHTAVYDTALVFGPEGVGTPASSGTSAIFSNSAAGSTNQHGLSFMTNLATRMVLTAAGQLGVGVTSVTTGALAEIKGFVGIGSGIAGATRTTANSAYLTIANASALNRKAAIQFSATGNLGSVTTVWEIGSDTSGDASHQQFYILDNRAAAGAGATRLVINDAGNIGIGAGFLNPLTLLDVAGAATVRSTLSAAGMIVDYLGVQANSGLTNALNFGNPGSGPATGIFSNRTDGASGHNQYGLDLFTSGTSRITVTEAGNVGIGTQAPTAHLGVGAPLVGAVMSPFLQVSGGALAAGAGSDIALASLGYTSGADTGAFGIHAYRWFGSTTYQNSAILIGMDVNGTPRTGATYLSFSGAGGIGINCVANVTGGAYVLDINVSTATNAGMRLYNASDATTYLAIGLNTNVGAFTGYTLAGDTGIDYGTGHALVIGPNGLSGGGARFDRNGRLGLYDTSGGVPSAILAALTPTTPLYVHGTSFAAGSFSNTAAVRGIVTIASFASPGAYQAIDFAVDSNTFGATAPIATGRIAFQQNTGSSVFAVGVSGPPTPGNGITAVPLMADYQGIITPTIRQSVLSAFLDDIIGDSHSASLIGAIRPVPGAPGRLQIVASATVPVGINIHGQWRVNTTTKQFDVPGGATIYYLIVNANATDKGFTFVLNPFVPVDTYPWRTLASFYYDGTSIRWESFDWSGLGGAAAFGGMGLVPSGQMGVRNIRIDLAGGAFTYTGVDSHWHKFPDYSHGVDLGSPFAWPYAFYLARPTLVQMRLFASLNPAPTGSPISNQLGDGGYAGVRLVIDNSPVAYGASWVYFVAPPSGYDGSNTIHVEQTASATLPAGVHYVNAVDYWAVPGIFLTINGCHVNLTLMGADPLNYVEGNPLGDPARLNYS